MDKTINYVSLKSLTFQTGQKKWNGGSIYIYVLLKKKKKKKPHQIQCGKIIISLNIGLLGYHISLWKIWDFPS